MTPAQLEQAMDLAQEFASSWSLVGTVFATDSQLQDAEAAKERLRRFLIASSPAGDDEIDAALWRKWANYLDKLYRKPFSLRKDLDLYMRRQKTLVSHETNP